MAEYKVVFDPFGTSVKVAEGATLLEAAAQARIALESPCGGDGICGRCKVIVKEGKVGGGVMGHLTRDEIRQGVVLACQTTVESDLFVEIPETTRAREKITIDKDAQRFRAERPGVEPREFRKDPLVTKVFLELDPPTLADNMSDSERVLTRIEALTGTASIQAGLKIIQRIPELLRDNDFAVTATIGRRREIAELMDIQGGDTSDTNLVAVVDTGTTTVVVHLVDAVRGTTIDTQACFNSQASFGREVTARMISAERAGAARLQDLLVGDINRLILSLAEKNDIALADITAVVCAGNTAMMHFLLGLPTRNIRREPFVGASSEPAPLRAAEVGIRIHPRGLLFTVPGIGGWVGGDITAGILATGLHEMDEICMFIDVGTNGEIVIGSREWLMACSASAGPALEGASVDCGMRAERGAIERAYLEDGEIRYDIIGGSAPCGICGSGIIDLIALLLDQGIISRNGAFVKGSDPRVRFDDGQGKYAIADGKRGAKGRALFISEEDISNVITAKASIFAAGKIMLDRLGLGIGDVNKLFLAGSFGSRINVENAIAIGLLPDLPVENISYVGNTSIWGAKLAALSTEAYDIMGDIVEKTTHYDLMGADDYVEQFQQAIFLPHTNVELFPSLAGRTNA